MSGLVHVDLATTAYATAGPNRQLVAVAKAAERVRCKLLTMAPVRAVHSIPRATLPFPSKFAFGGAGTLLPPLVSMLHRTLLVQFEQHGHLRNLLFNPTDVERARNTPYFARLLRRIGPFERLASKPFPDIVDQLAKLGLSPGDIDYLAFDHFHTQDLRRLIGTSTGQRPLYPSATLLAPRCEWDEWNQVHPIQRDFMIRDGRRDVQTNRVALLDHDVVLGSGVMLVRTPGHTCGNQTLFIRTQNGIWGVSENGTSADCWQPDKSRIRGLRRFAKNTGHEVLGNCNTPESGATQYAAMMLERAVVDRNRCGAVQMWPSSEFTPTTLALGVRPTTLHGELRLGRVGRAKRVASRGSLSPQQVRHHA